MSHGPNHEPVISAATQPLPKKLVLWCVVAIVGGLAGAGLTTSQSAERAMTNFLQNSVFWLGVSQGGFMLAVAMTLTKARWGRSLKRIAEAFGLFVPVVYVGIIAFLALGGIDIFPWMHEDLPYHKKVYLTESFFFWRQVGGLGLLTAGLTAYYTFRVWFRVCCGP